MYRFPLSSAVRSSHIKTPIFDGTNVVAFIVFKSMRETLPFPLWATYRLPSAPIWAPLQPGSGVSWVSLTTLYLSSSTFIAAAKVVPENSNTNTAEKNNAMTVEDFLFIFILQPPLLFLINQD